VDIETDVEQGCLLKSMDLGTASPADAKVSPDVNGRTCTWPAMILSGSASSPAQNREVTNQAVTGSVSASVVAMLNTRLVYRCSLPVAPGDGREPVGGKVPR
jgi:hypothetical protein